MNAERDGQAAYAGIDLINTLPRLTWRRLWRAYRRKLQETWAQTSSIVAMVHNAREGAKQRPASYFNPMTERDRADVRERVRDWMKDE